MLSRELFDRLMQQKDVFKDKHLLTSDYIPPVFGGRDEPQEELSRILVSRTRSEYMSRMVVLYGPTGSGKTMVVKDVLNSFKEYDRGLVTVTSPSETPGPGSAQQTKY